MENCTKVNCKHELGNGDRLFCYKHRQDWRNFCKKHYVHNKIISEDLEKYLLDVFVSDIELTQEEIERIRRNEE